MLQNPHVLLTFDKVHNPLWPCACHTKRHLNLQKWSEPLVLLTFWLRKSSKCESRHNGVHFFDISTSKSGPRMVCFVQFDLEMCFAPQRRALFRHLNIQKWREHVVFLTFWLRNVLRATTACNFSSLIWPAGSAPAALASLLFDPPELQIIGNTQCFATFLPFRASASSFFWLFLFSDLLSSALLFSILLLHLCFSSVDIVGSLTSKLPSITIKSHDIPLKSPWKQIKFPVRWWWTGQDFPQQQGWPFTPSWCIQRRPWFISWWRWDTLCFDVGPSHCVVMIKVDPVEDRSQWSQAVLCSTGLAAAFFAALAMLCYSFLVVALERSWS